MERNKRSHPLLGVAAFFFNGFFACMGGFVCRTFFLIRVLELEALYAYTSIDTVAILAQGKHSG